MTIAEIAECVLESLISEDGKTWWMNPEGDTFPSGPAFTSYLTKFGKNSNDIMRNGWLFITQDTPTSVAVRGGYPNDKQAWRIKEFAQTATDQLTGQPIGL